MVCWADPAAALTVLPAQAAHLEVDIEAHPSSVYVLSVTGLPELLPDETAPTLARRRPAGGTRKEARRRARARNHESSSTWRESGGVLAGGAAGTFARLVSLFAMAIGASGLFLSSTLLSPLLGPAALLAIGAALLVGQGLISSLAFAAASTVVFGLFSDAYQGRFWSMWGAAFGAELLASTSAVVAVAAFYGLVFTIDGSTVLGAVQLGLATVVSGGLSVVPVLLLMLVVPPALSTAALALTAEPRPPANARRAALSEVLPRRVQTLRVGLSF